MCNRGHPGCRQMWLQGQQRGRGASGATFLLWICLPCCLREGSSGSRRSASAGPRGEKHMESLSFAFVFCEMVGLDYQEFPARSTPTRTCSPGHPAGGPLSSHGLQDPPQPLAPGKLPPRPAAPKRSVFDAPDDVLSKPLQE